MYLLRNSFILCGLLASALISCIGGSERRLTVFYDFDSLIHAQVIQLTSMQPVLKKEADIDGKREVVEIDKTDSSKWAKELDIFRQLNLNDKILNERRYEIQKDLPDATSNLRICQYIAKTDLPLSLVRIYYEGKLENIRKVEGFFRESNGLYSSSRFLSMELTDINDQALLTGYSIEGNQKMMLGDSVKFKIKGTLSFIQ
jgi:hypothetical protein